MTTIKYKKSDNDFELAMDGHAGFAEAGKDIICAGLTTLLMTLCSRLEDVGTTLQVDLSKEGGHAAVKASGRQAVEAFDTCLTGFKILAKQYPHFVSIKKL